MAYIEIPSDWSITKRAVFKNGKRVIAAFGIEKSTNEDIARGIKEDEMPPSKLSGTVSVHLARAAFSKESLLKTIQDLGWDGINKKIDEILGRNKGLKEKLFELSQEIPALLEEDLEATAILIRERYPIDDTTEALNGSPDAMNCLAKLSAFFKELHKQEILKPELDPHAVFHTFYGAIEHCMLHAYVLYASFKDSKVKGFLAAHDFVEKTKKVLYYIIANMINIPKADI